VHLLQKREFDRREADCTIQEGLTPARGRQFNQSRTQPVKRAFRRGDDGRGLIRIAHFPKYPVREMGPSGVHTVGLTSILINCMICGGTSYGSSACANHLLTHILLR
jgi:hypothetical protein